MTRGDFIVRTFGTGLMYTLGKRDPDLTINNNSAYDAQIFYRGQNFSCPHYRSVEIQAKEDVKNSAVQ